MFSYQFLLEMVYWFDVGLGVSVRVRESERDKAGFGFRNEALRSMSKL